MSEHDLVIDYINHQLSEEERKKFEEHLENCSECRREVEELQMLMSDLPYSADPVEPPADLKDRVLSAAFLEEEPELVSGSDLNQTVQPVSMKQKRQRSRFLVPSLAAVLFLSLLGNAVWLISEVEPDDTSNQDVVQVQQAVALQPLTENYEAQATLLEVGKGKQLLLQASELSPLEEGEVYQIWLIEGETPYPTGSLVPNSQGSGAVVYSLPIDLEEMDWDQVAISIEPDHTSTVPRGEVVLAGAF
ncbi:hypothetical protein Q75_16305 [Bacillus coahuilensis p1.1.43]|uniref:Anti-sigma-W factor RsiW n=1 Tax=Bacillus coahuilensis p1.1.43 TaxID=1150625 RepID=A0A147K4B1_9BACI|nr:anti-sigma factor [Bacillus coahuilensis]KUP04147.1 hypothetical protein Q75_16305 [Bacillus coahuilensis p1.1.43]